MKNQKTYCGAAVKLSFKFFASALLAVLLVFISDSTRATSSVQPEQQLTNQPDRPAVTLRAGSTRQRPHPREVMFSEDPLLESRHQRWLIDREPTARSHKGARDDYPGSAQSTGSEPASNREQWVGAQNNPSNVRLTIRDIGPEIGGSGSGSGFVFNRDPRQVILPTSQRVFRSLNGGSNWSPSDLTVAVVKDSPDFRLTDGSYFVRQDSQNPHILYAATANSFRLVRSNDFGATWTQLGDWDLDNVRDVAVHEASPNVLLALRRVGWGSPPLWRSEDGGATFTPQWDAGLPLETFDEETYEGCFPSYTNIATTPADPNLVYVVQRGGDPVHCPPAIHKSIDGGRTFARLAASPSRFPIQVFPHPTRPEVLFVQLWAIRPDSSLYRSTDGGASFQPVAGGLTNHNFFVSFDRNNPSLVYVAGRGGVFRSQDGGGTFQPLGLTTEQLGQGATNVNVDPSDSQVIYVNTFKGNFKSVNGGRTFKAINNGWKAAVIRHIAFDNSSEPNLYLATSDGIMRTNTRGNHFERVPHSSILNNATLLAVAPSDPNMILAATSRSTLHRTLDGGESWTQASVDPGPVHLDAAFSGMLVDPKDSNNIYFVLGDTFQPFALYKSVDAGATFESTFYNDFAMSALAIDPINTNVIYTASSDSFDSRPLLRSVDGGLTFAPTCRTNFLNSGVTDILVDPHNPDNIFIVGQFSPSASDPFDQHNIMRSTDGGATFSPADAGLRLAASFGSPLLVMHPQDSTRLYAWSRQGLHLTTDSGNTWNLIPADEIVRVIGFQSDETESNTMLINPKKPNLIYLLGSSLLEVEIHFD